MFDLLRRLVAWLTNPPTNVCGRVSSVVLMCPIADERADVLRAHLNALPRGDTSPFARLGGVHLARFLVLDQLVDQGPPQEPDGLRSSYLLFSCVVDGTNGPFLERFCTRLGPEIDAIWSHCVGYPGRGSIGRLKAYFRRCQIDATFFLAAYPNATVPEILEALALRQRVIDFATRAQSLDPVALQRALVNDLLAPATPASV